MFALGSVATTEIPALPSVPFVGLGNRYDNDPDAFGSWSQLLLLGKVTTGSRLQLCHSLGSRLLELLDRQ